jgi:hypothetical protein
MKKTSRREWFLILGLILAITLMNLPVAYTFFYHEITGAPKALKGSMDLSTVKLDQGKIYLDGQWEFYWNSFIVSEPKQLAKPDLIIAVPDEWSKYKIDGKNLPASGYGSYKLTLKEHAYDNRVTAFVHDFGGAYRVFIDGQLASKSGILSKTIDSIFTVPKSDLYPVDLSVSKTHEIVIEVATTRFSGLYMTPVFSNYNQIMKENSVRNALRFIFFGIALFSFFSLIAMYVVNVKRKLHSFWMPVMILFILIRMMLTTEFYSVWQPLLFFNLSYESTNEMMYFITFTLKYLLIYLVQEQCGISFVNREKIGFLSYYILLYSIYLFAPQSIYNRYLSVLIPMLTYILDFYLVYKIYHERQKLKKISLVIFGAVTLVVAGLTLDSYYINGKIYMNMSLTLMALFTLFSMIMTWIYTMRIGDLYDDFTESSSRLELVNNQIAIQKEYYEALSGQMSEIRSMKHDIRHFIGAMSRLAEERRFDQLKVFLEEYKEKAEMEQLPVFCENVIGNSIIGYYYLRTIKYGIPFECRSNISRQSSIMDSDLCIILGNALENAIDACRQMEHSEKQFISLDTGTMKGQWLLKVRNSFAGQLEIREGRLNSTKSGKSHGLGIQNMEKVAKSYGGFVKLEHNEKEFTFMIAIPEK